MIGAGRGHAQKNMANNNVDIGIDAPDGTIDEGGNTATGNGAPTASASSACRRRSRSKPRVDYR